MNVQNKSTDKLGRKETKLLSQERLDIRKDGSSFSLVGSGDPRDRPNTQNYVRCSRTEHKWKSCTVRPAGRLKGLAVIQINERGSRRGSARLPAILMIPRFLKWPTFRGLSLSLSRSKVAAGRTSTPMIITLVHKLVHNLFPPLSAFFYSEPTILLHPLLLHPVPSIPPISPLLLSPDPLFSSSPSWCRLYSAYNSLRGEKERERDSPINEVPTENL